jgi:hypothetical protein
MKPSIIVLVIFTLNLSLLKSVSITSVDDDIRDRILSNMIDKPSKELFKIYNFLYEKNNELNSDEAITRYRAFKSNLEKIKNVNSQNLGYKYGFNHMTDTPSSETEEETFYADQGENAFLKDGNDALTQTTTTGIKIDWSNLIRRTHTQGTCNTAHKILSALTSIEANYKKQFKADIEISAQHAIDCSGGCSSPSHKFDWMINNGAVANSAYPSSSNWGAACRTGVITEKVILSYEECSTSKYSCDFQSWLDMLQSGPIQASVNPNANIRNYTSGILENVCTSKVFPTLDVVVVGINNDGDGKGDYLIVRASYGSTWGEKGNFKIRIHHQSDTCGLTRNALLPCVTKASDIFAKIGI